MARPLVILVVSLSTLASLSTLVSLSALASLSAFSSLSLFSSPAQAGERAISGTGGSSLGLESLLERFSRVPGLEAVFREEKSLTLLREPLISRGRLYYAAAGRLARYTEEPVDSLLLVEGERLSYASGGERGAIDLDSNPAVRVFVDSFRLLLKGDLPRLRERFEIDFASASESGRDGWRVRLIPRDPSLSGFLSSIQIEGRELLLSQLRILEKSGDETAMFFSSVQVDRRFKREELDSLFRLPAP